LDVEALMAMALPASKPHLTPQVEWLASTAPVPYPDALAFMDGRATAIARGDALDCVWLLEHPSIYTAGTSADPAELLGPDRFPVFKSGRGGRFTYHGPGQRVAYVMLDLTRRGRVSAWRPSAGPARSASSCRAPSSPASAYG
jgi:lipoyl(octanoyl) transferase